MSEHELSRRQVLAFGAGGLASLAGCSSSPVGGPPSVFEDVSFEGTDMVVRLRADHDVDRVNLVSPDGSLFTRVNVPVGATTVRLQVLDLDAGAPEHYTPGENTLVAVSGEETVEKHQFLLEPEVAIVAVDQHQETNREVNGHLAVTLENKGTAPTWVHQITYEDAPNFAANDGLSDSPGVLLVSELSERSDVVIGEGETKTYIGTSPPLIFPEKGAIGTDCSGEVHLTLIVSSATGPVIVEDLTINPDGEARVVDTFGDFTCSSAEITGLGDQE